MFIVYIGRKDQKPKAMFQIALEILSLKFDEFRNQDCVPSIKQHNSVFDQFNSSKSLKNKILTQQENNNKEGEERSSFGLVI